MAETITQEILFKSQSSNKTAPATMRTESFAPQEQKMRALKALLSLWAVAAVCVLIPIAHFVLVPGFLFGGIIVASRRWKSEREGIDASGSCPECDKQVTISLDKNPDLPQWHPCPECDTQLELQAGETA